MSHILSSLSPFITQPLLSHFLSQALGQLLELILAFDQALHAARQHVALGRQRSHRARR